MDIVNETAKDPRFCVNLKINKGWITSINLESEEGILPPQEVLVDYDKLPIRCKACLSWKHMVKDCNEMGKKLVWRERRPFRPPVQHQGYQ